MKFVSTAMAVVLAAGVASADDGADAFRAYVRAWEDSRGSEGYERQQAELKKRPGIAAEWVKVTSTVLLGEFSSDTLTYSGCSLLEGLEPDLVEPLRALLSDKDEARLEYAVKLACHANLCETFAKEMIGLLSREDDAANAVRNYLRGVKDPQVIAMLVEEAGKPGMRGYFGLYILCYLHTPEAHAYLRKVALDATADVENRRSALMGLAPFLGEDDRRVLLTCLKDPALYVAIDAAQRLDQEKSVAGVADLKALQVRLQKGIADFPDGSFERQRYREGLVFVDCLLAVAGDLDALKITIQRAEAGYEDALVDAAIRSPLHERIPLLLEFLDKAKDPPRSAIFRGLTRTVDEAELPQIRAACGEGDYCSFAQGLGDRLRKSAQEAQAYMEFTLGFGDYAADALAELNSAWLGEESATGSAFGHRVLQEDIILLEKHAKSRAARAAIANVLQRFADDQIGDSAADVPKWRAWYEDMLVKNRTE